MEKEIIIGRLYTEMYKECKKRLAELGYVPELHEIVLNSKKLKDLIKSGGIGSFHIEEAYESALEDLDNE
jgi:ketol-acid reductoisomerase